MADEHDIDAALNGGWYHYHLNLAGYNQLGSDLNAKRLYPKLHTHRAIAESENAARGSDASYMLRVSTEFKNEGAGSSSSGFEADFWVEGPSIPTEPNGPPVGSPLLTKEYEALLIPQKPTEI